jgi:ATP-dependent DNA ligase
VEWQLVLSNYTPMAPTQVREPFRARLENVVAGNDLVLPVRRLAKNGFEAWSEVVAHDYEGLVAKDEASLYEAGPTRRWLKVKQKGWTVDDDRWRRRVSTGA